MSAFDFNRKNIGLFLLIFMMTIGFFYVSTTYTPNPSSRSYDLAILPGEVVTFELEPAYRETEVEFSNIPFLDANISLFIFFSDYYNGSISDSGNLHDSVLFNASTYSYVFALEDEFTLAIFVDGIISNDGEVSRIEVKIQNPPLKERDVYQLIVLLLTISWIFFFLIVMREFNQIKRMAIRKIRYGSEPKLDVESGLDKIFSREERTRAEVTKSSLRFPTKNEKFPKPGQSKKSKNILAAKDVKINPGVHVDKSKVADKMVKHKEIQRVNSKAFEAAHGSKIENSINKWTNILYAFILFALVAFWYLVTGSFGRTRSEFLFYFLVLSMILILYSIRKLSKLTFRGDEEFNPINFKEF